MGLEYNFIEMEQEVSLDLPHWRTVTNQTTPSFYLVRLLRKQRLHILGETLFALYCAHSSFIY